ncbi:MAG: universal stress protein UspA [Bacteroidia bacterium]|nr:MAG: universal stress protein UspA [Bacteroidia bacterium]
MSNLSFNILLPTDFSDLSLKALKYGLKLNKKINGEVTLFHALYLPGLADNVKKKLEDLLKKESLEELEILEKKLRKEKQLSGEVKKRVEFGVPSKAISDYAKKNDIDLIVMGTKGAGKISKALFGSNTAHLLEKTNTSVCVVPEEYEVKERFVLKHIVYASDLEDIDNEIKLIAAFARMFDATIHVVHVMPETGKIIPLKPEKIVPDLQKKAKYDKITFYAATNNNFHEVIKNYAHKHKVDLIALYMHKRSFWQSLFQTSHSKELSYYTDIPLMVLPKMK